MATLYGGYRLQSRSYRWQDWAILFLAVWLFISPWVLQFGTGPIVAVSHAAWNAWVLG